MAAMPPNMQGAWPLSIAMLMMVSMPESEMAEAPSSASSTALKSKMAVEALKEQQAAEALDAALEPLKEQQVMLKKQQAVARPRLSTPPRGPRNKKAKSVSGARIPGVVTTESGAKKPGLVTNVAPLVPKKIGLQAS